MFVQLLREAVERLVAFIEVGGWVLSALFLVTFLMWALIIERWWYFRFKHKHDRAWRLSRWAPRRDRTSWFATQVRQKLVAQTKEQLDRGMPFLRCLVALCPLLGLLGTVTGMIEIFDVMAVAGNSNPRAMASGVSRATVPTMAGMFTALIGLVVSVRLSRTSRALALRFESALERD
jgi:biopolymer transport protein ExbB